MSPLPRPRVLCIGWMVCAALSNVRAQDIQNCHIGSYRLSNGTLVDIAPDEGDTLRWLQLDGETGSLYKKSAKGAWTSTRGWTDEPDGKVVAFSACREGRIQFDGISGQRVTFDVRNTTFESHGVTLAGRLVLPIGSGTVPIVVLLHGSERMSALIDYSLQRTLPAEGVGAFVYDKRGTGKSGGSYSQDFGLLADDAVAAMREARRLGGTRVGRIGYQGGSQGGWVAPIAANRAPVDFVIVCYGLAVSVIDEDQESVEIQLRERGYSANEIAAAQTVAGAAEDVVASGFTQGFERFDTLRAKYRGAPWYKDLRGDYTYFFLPYSTAQLRKRAPQFKWGTPFHYDPMPTLEADQVPQLWILGGEDYEAPSAETRRRLTALIGEGRPFTVAYYAHAEHGMTLFETGADGSRTSTRYEPGYFSMIRDFAVDGRLHGPYGDAQLTTPGNPRPR
jgi:dienelactone hydrolase